MARYRFPKSEHELKELKVLSQQFFNLVTISDTDKRVNYLAVVKIIDPNLLEKEMDLLHKKTFQEMFKNNLYSPVYNLMLVLDERTQLDENKIKKKFNEFEELIKEMEIYINELYKCIPDPLRGLPQLNNKTRLKYISNENKKIYTDFKTSYNAFITNWNNYLIKHKLARSFNPKFMREYDDIKENY